MSRLILDASIRSFISRGTWNARDGRLIPIENVIPGLASAEAPAGLYAAVHMINETPIGRNTGWQFKDDTQSFTVDGVMLKSTYSVHFYRARAIEAASLFVDWTRSESGINWASTALTDGRIKGVNVYAGGSGYAQGGTCSFVPDPNLQSIAGEEPTSPATGRVVVNDSGEMERIVMTSFGENYFDMPIVEFSDVGDGTGAVVAPRGFGFDIKHPLMIRNLTGTIADDFEERAQLDLMICHTRIYTDMTSGRVEEFKQDQS